MNFGDILNQWDKQTAASTGKKAMSLKDAEPGESRSLAGERRRRLLRKRPDAVLDLHNLTQDEAWTTLETFFENSRREGFEKVLVIHGKGLHSEGDAVLKEVSRKFIEACPFAGESGHSAAADGGRGSTWVLLKA
jgi:DNA-nicking Smr family endonuclease